MQTSHDRAIAGDRNEAKTVQFRVHDIVTPDLATLLPQLFGDFQLEGRVIDRSEGDGEQVFLAVDVEGAAAPVVIRLADPHGREGSNTVAPGSLAGGSSLPQNARNL